MARKNVELNYYPDQFFDVVRGAGLRGESLSVICTNAKQARQLRGLYYAFIGSLRAKAGAIPTPATTPEERELQDLARSSYQIFASIRPLPDDRAQIIWSGRENSWQAGILKSLTVLKPQSDLPEEIKTSLELDRLIRTQREVDKGESQ